MFRAISHIFAESSACGRRDSAEKYFTRADCRRKPLPPPCGLMPKRAESRILPLCTRRNPAEGRGLRRGLVSLSTRPTPLRLTLRSRFDRCSSPSAPVRRSSCGTNGAHLRADALAPKVNAERMTGAAPNRLRRHRKAPYAGAAYAAESTPRFFATSAILQKFAF